MHEMAVVTELADAVIEAARGAGAARIKAVYLTIGQGRDVVPEIFEGMWEHYTKGTLAEGAVLQIECRPYLVRCSLCGFLYHLDPFDPSTHGCPSCSGQDYRLYSGMEFSIDRVEIV
mgnify:CR=1 FL=1